MAWNDDFIDEPPNSDGSGTPLNAARLNPILRAIERAGHGPYADGEILIGDGSANAIRQGTITAGDNIEVGVGPGTITISSGTRGYQQGQVLVGKANGSAQKTKITAGRNIAIDTTTNDGKIVISALDQVPDPNTVEGNIIMRAEGVGAAWGAGYLQAGDNISITQDGSDLVIAANMALGGARRTIWLLGGGGTPNINSPHGGPDTYITPNYGHTYRTGKYSQGGGGIQEWDLLLPRNFARGPTDATVAIRAVFYVREAVGGTVALGLSLYARGDGDLMDAPNAGYMIVQRLVQPAQNYRILYTPWLPGILIAGADPLGGKILHAQSTRAQGDTLQQDIYLIGWVISYPIDRYSDEDPPMEGV